MGNISEKVITDENGDGDFKVKLAGKKVDSSGFRFRNRTTIKL